jgi:hypothetical protein
MRNPPKTLVTQWFLTIHCLWSPFSGLHHFSFCRAPSAPRDEKGCSPRSRQCLSRGGFEDVFHEQDEMEAVGG